MTDHEQRVIAQTLADAVAEEQFAMINLLATEAHRIPVASYRRLIETILRRMHAKRVTGRGSCGKRSHNEPA